MEFESSQGDAGFLSDNADTATAERVGGWRRACFRSMVVLYDDGSKKGRLHLIRKPGYRAIQTIWQDPDMTKMSVIRWIWTRRFVVMQYCTKIGWVCLLRYVLLWHYYLLFSVWFCLITSHQKKQKLPTQYRSLQTTNHNLKCSAKKCICQMECAKNVDKCTSASCHAGGELPLAMWSCGSVDFPE